MMADRKARKWARLIGLATPLIAMLVAAAPTAAQAAPSYGVGCTPSTSNPSGTVCITTGSNTRVSRNSYSFWSNICDYKASLTYYYPGGGVDTLWKYRNGCSTAHAWFDFNANWNVPKGTTMCGSFYQKVNRNSPEYNRDGTACRRV